jgi:CHAT domain-containing protein/Tfp pilus assembly protein PilF
MLSLSKLSPGLQRKKATRRICASRRYLVLLMTFTVAALVSASGQSSPPGVVVEKIARGLAADKAGLRETDTILSWARGGDHGRIDSPFDLSAVEVEQAPRGVITLNGLRGQESLTWTLNPSNNWGVEVRPQLPQNLLDIYEQGRKAANAGHVDEALERWMAASSEASQSSPPWLAIWLMSRRATILAKAQQREQADQAYQQMIERTSQLYPTAEAQLLRRWAETFYQRGENDRAAEIYRQALAKNRSLAPQSMEAAANLTNLGHISRNLGDLDGAEKDFKEALAIRETLAPGSLAVSWALGNLSTVASERGALTHSQDLLEKALAIKERVAPGSRDLALTLEKLGTLARARGNLRKAEEYYKEARAIIEPLEPGGPTLASILSSSGGVASDRGDWPHAKELFRSALIMMEKADPQNGEIPTFLNNLGGMELVEGNLDNARDYLKKALRLLPPGKSAGTLNNLGDIARKQSDLDGAEQYYTHSQEVEQKQAPTSPTVAENLYGLGEIARQRKDYTAAETYHHQALEIRELFGATGRTESLAALGSIMRVTGRLDESANFFDQALHALENQVSLLGGNEETRSTFRASHSDFYREYIDVLVRRNQPELAFQVLERSRARTLLELLTEAHIDIRNGVDQALLEQERSLEADFTAKSDRRIRLLNGRHTNEQLAEVAEEIRHLEAQIKDVREQIRVRSPNYAALTQPQVLGLEEIQRHVLDPDTLLLAYSLGTEWSYAFAVTQDSLAVFKLPRRDEIEAMALKAYREELSVNNPAAGHKVTDAVSTMLLGQIANRLHKKRLAIIADGALQYIPFAALRTSSGILLGAQHEIVSLPSASTLAVLRKGSAGRVPASRLVAVLADPVFAADDERVKQTSLKTGEKFVALSSQISSDQHAAAPVTHSAADAGTAVHGALRLARLPSTRREAESILAVTPAGKGMTALDFDASRSTATDPVLAQYRIVHMASHALIDSRRPAFSGIVLSLVDRLGNPQNGFLGLEDIYNLNLSADLVVLSACETGLGKNVQGEGLIGLARGFMFAGAPRLVVSLWQVPDRATAELMKEFYRGMLTEKLRPLAALRRAQMNLAKDARWSSPYYWAGFTLQGDWQ